MNLSKESVIEGIKTAQTKAIRMIIRILFFSPLALLIGMAMGMRMFETGRVIYLKGSTVRVSGVCKLGDKERLPALADDQVTVTNINEKEMTGVIRKTREAVKCDLSEIAIDKLPLFSDFSQNPVLPPEIAPAKIVDENPWGIDLVNRTFKVTGSCQNTVSGSNEALLDHVVVFTSAKKKQGQESGTLLGVIRSEGRLKGTSIQCDSSQISYEPATLEVVKSDEPVKLEEDLKGKTLVVTSTCFPDKRYMKPGDDQVFYQLIKDLIEVTEYERVNGEVVWISGALMSKGTMVSCDAKKYPINWRIYDPTTMKLTPLQVQKDKEPKK